MEKQILDILKEYENKPADFYFVKEILNILRKYYHCDDQLKKILVYRYCDKNEQERNFAGLYDSYNKSIYIDVSAYDHFKITQSQKNIGVLVLILHEFAHAIQEKINNNSMESKLIKISNHVNEEKFGVLHDYIPDERLANIKSIMWCINILSGDFLKYQDEISRKKKLLYNYLLDGYSIENYSLLFPLEILFKETNQYEENKKIIEYGRRLSFAERLLYGLPITRNEYNELKNIYDKQCEEEKSKTRLKIIIE